MAILKVVVRDDQAGKLKLMLHDIEIVKSVEEEPKKSNEPDEAYIKIKKLLDSAKGRELFQDITDPVEWQKDIRKELKRDIWC